jgi:PTH2 family peptidyl-tRNA hydrolase
MEHKQVIVMRKDLNMRKGKLVAQGAHASLGAILQQMRKDGDRLVLDLTDPRLEPWITGRFKKICVYVNNEEELLALFAAAKLSDMICSLITDAGLTEFNGVPTNTCIAIGPDFEDKVDELCKHLPLY